MNVEAKIEVRPEVKQDESGKSYLAFANSVDAEFFLRKLGMTREQIQEVPFWNVGGYENAIEIQ